MILSKDIEDIFNIWHFYEGYISEIKWNETLEDLLISINYFWDEPKGYKDKDIILNFKKCFKATFNFTKAQKYGKIADGLYMEVDSIKVENDGDIIHILIDSNYFETMIDVYCQEVWLEE